MYGVEPVETKGKPPLKTRAIALDLPVKVLDRMEQLAKAGNSKLHAYAASLLMAAYTARVHGETGDRDLDDQVGRVVLLDALHEAPEAIAKYVGLTPETIAKILAVWRAEMAWGGVS